MLIWLEFPSVRNNSDSFRFKLGLGHPLCICLTTQIKDKKSEGVI